MVGLDNSAERCFGVTPDWYKSGNSDAIKKSIGIAHDGQEHDYLEAGKTKSSSRGDVVSFKKALESGLSLYLPLKQ